MITLYSGTPGSGKSYHTAQLILSRLKYKHTTIGNFPINNYKGYKGSYVFVSNARLSPDYLINFSKDYFASHKFKEGSIYLLIDEAQLIFNSRDFLRKDRLKWLSFFTQHRHLGYNIILICQFDRMLDRQIRCLIEYEYIHRKVKNFGWRGWFLSFWCLGNLFCAVKYWYPLKEKISSEFYVLNPRVYRLYDSYCDFNLLMEV